MVRHIARVSVVVVISNYLLIEININAKENMLIKRKDFDAKSQTKLCTYSDLLEICIHHKGSNRLNPLQEPALLHTHNAKIYYVTGVRIHDSPAERGPEKHISAVRPDLGRPLVILDCPDRVLYM